MTTKIKTTYTPGPWTVDEIDGGCLIGADKLNGSHIAQAMSLPDARLIASAPELLEALKRVRHAFYVDGSSKALRLAFENTKELVAKAEGRI
jgi:hypothetical protein